ATIAAAITAAITATIATAVTATIAAVTATIDTARWRSTAGRRRRRNLAAATIRDGTTGNDGTGNKEVGCFGFAGHGRSSKVENCCKHSNNSALFQHHYTSPVIYLFTN